MYSPAFRFTVFGKMSVDHLPARSHLLYTCGQGTDPTAFQKAGTLSVAVLICSVWSEKGRKFKEKLPTNIYIIFFFFKEAYGLYYQSRKITRTCQCHWERIRKQPHPSVNIKYNDVRATYITIIRNVKKSFVTRSFTFVSHSSNQNIENINLIRTI